MAKIFTIINNKGGTGKTTTALNLGAALSRKKKKVLLIDMDAQCNLSSSLGLNGENLHIGDAMVGKAGINDLPLKCEKLDVIPASDKLIEYESQINNEPGREFLLRESLEKLERAYDFVIIDCAPNLGIYATNSLVASDFYIVPMQAENFAFIGLDKILQIADKVKVRLNAKLELAGILIVRQSQRTKFSEAVITNIGTNEILGNKLFKTVIRQDIALMESAAFGQSVFEYANSSRGADDYNKFANEIIKLYGKE